MSFCNCNIRSTSALLFTLLVGLLSQRLEAQSIQLSADRDNTLLNSENTGNVNSNGQGNLFAGLTGPTGVGEQRALLFFDIASQIPAGSTITDVQLTLSVEQGGGGSSNTDEYSLHRLLQDWGEGSSDSTGGGGAPATTGDATWLHTFFDTAFWTTPGGDFVGSPSASEQIGTFGEETWDSTPELVADVQDWLDNPSDNYGWILIGNEFSANSSRRFGSRENSTGAPVLQISFIPEPSTIFLGMLSMGYLAVNRRRNR